MIAFLRAYRRFQRWWGPVWPLWILALVLAGCGPHAKTETVTKTTTVYRQPDKKMSRAEFDSLKYGTSKAKVIERYGYRSDNDLGNVHSGFGIADELNTALTGSGDSLLIFPERDGKRHFVLLFVGDNDTLVMKGIV